MLYTYDCFYFLVPFHLISEVEMQNTHNNEIHFKKSVSIISNSIIVLT